jgi:hypothetical protein
VPAPAVGRRLRVDARGCRPEADAIESAEIGRSRQTTASARIAGSVAAGWQLTNRGIAVVLVAGAVLAAAALTVITATAITVTSEGYHPHGSALAHR